MDRQQKINELIELLNVPGVEKVVFLSFSRAKRTFEEEINQYKNLKNGFRKTAYGEMQVYERPGRSSGPAYRFEINREDDNCWILTMLEPPPPEGVDPDDIVPPDLIDLIGVYKTDPEKIYTQHNSFITPSGRKSFEVQFTKYSDGHALGVIREIKVKKGGKNPPKNPANLLKINDYYKKKTRENNYDKLFYYMEKFPQFKEHIFSEFFMKWKPLIDQGMVEFTLN